MTRVSFILAGSCEAPPVGAGETAVAVHTSTHLRQTPRHRRRAADHILPARQRFLCRSRPPRGYRRWVGSTMNVHPSAVGTATSMAQAPPRKGHGNAETKAYSIAGNSSGGRGRLIAGRSSSASLASACRRRRLSGRPPPRQPASRKRRPPRAPRSCCASSLPCPGTRPRVRGVC